MVILLVWTMEDWHFERIKFDEFCFSECIVTSKAFFINAILVDAGKNLLKTN